MAAYLGIDGPWLKGRRQLAQAERRVVHMPFFGLSGRRTGLARRRGSSPLKCATYDRVTAPRTANPAKAVGGARQNSLREQPS